ncbi:Hypothetical predicted protein [Mytilus galloprovincialis]|uniref:Uncharacterized protein n=1 Tax=Mytilus galloprovincialis TaxID=29158 RepID=A0A8B6GUZ0_MYTGA|nr:Hypothetical predicted protein [Mytilus galloprovincialis]
MNGNSKQQDNFDDENLLVMKKTTYWDIYGVKRFSYPGKRKFTPLLYQSLDGGRMVILNDVFGLTISQFERKYRACLERRKSKEQWILNLRYPDKSSKEYLEYLENCTVCNKGKIDQSNNKVLLGVLESIQCRGVDGLIHNLFSLNNEHPRSLSTKSESSFISLDFLLYKTTCPAIDTVDNGVSRHYKALPCIYSLLNCESSTFIIDSCNFFKDNISQIVVQLLLSPNTIGTTYNIRKRYHTLFRHIIKTDAVSGWLLYSSFYYVTRQFNVALRITDYVLSRWSPCMLLVDSGVDSDIQTNEYRHNVHTSMSLNERLKIATAQHVHYGPNSSLIPEELKLEVESEVMNILPNVMCNCLRFLCYRHLGDIFNRQQAIRDLYKAVKDKYLSANTESNALTLLGVCFEISGDKDIAYQCYDEALQCDSYICPSAEVRRPIINGERNM